MKSCQIDPVFVMVIVLNKAAFIVRTNRKSTSMPIIAAFVATMTCIASLPSAAEVARKGKATLVMRGVDDVVADFFVGAVVAVLARLQVCGVQVYAVEVAPGFFGIRFSFAGCLMPGAFGPG